MNGKRKVIFPDDLRETYFPELEAGALPSRLQLKEKILELHKAGDAEGAAKLLPWNDKLKNSEPESRFTKASKIVMFCLTVGAVTLGILWLLFGGIAGKSDALIVCSVGGQTMKGAQCLSQNPETHKQEAKPSEESPDIFVGQ